MVQILLNFLQNALSLLDRFQVAITKGQNQTEHSQISKLPVPFLQSREMPILDRGQTAAVGTVQPQFANLSKSLLQVSDINDGPSSDFSRNEPLYAQTRSVSITDIL